VLTPVQELSIKTATKLEKDCKCRLGEIDTMLKEWKESRLSPASHESSHVEAFKKALAMNVDQGWDNYRTPYIPTGHASLTYSRGDGGSWNREEFSTKCRVMGVMSSGKPRIVTLYSSENSRLLKPLHDSLYRTLGRKGWLLVGSPTNELVGRLNGAGPYVSVDYKSATDNIKATYVRAAIEVLKKKANGLSVEEERALDVLADIGLSDSTPTETGQPMGSLMSFPVLCLINKTVVDMAVSDRARRGEISWKEFRVHRCLINGDDLLYRELKSDTPRGTLAGILAHGSQVGLRVNEEKTMVDPQWAEVNSTAFLNGIKQKKTNVGCVEWREEVSDPIGYLAESVRRRCCFQRMLLSWRGAIARCPEKLQCSLDRRLYRCLMKIKDSLKLRPSRRPMPHNLFPVVPRPAGYDLTREEEVKLITARVNWLQEDRRFWRPKVAPGRTKLEEDPRPIRRILERKTPTDEDTILDVLRVGWEEKRYREILDQEGSDLRLAIAELPTCIECLEGQHSKITCMVNMISQSGTRAGRMTQGPRNRPGCSRIDSEDFVPWE
jgi:hypothetical protein